MRARIAALRRVSRVAVTLFLLPAGSPSAADPASPLSPRDALKAFRTEPGLRVELVAAEPQIAKPINLNFDARGRLYVTQTVEYPQPGELDHGRDAVQVLEDRDGDGRYETVAAWGRAVAARSRIAKRRPCNACSMAGWR